MKRSLTLPPLFAAACLLLAAVGFTQAEETESDPTPTLGYQRVILVHGWNLVSFPLADDTTTVSDVFGGRLQGGETEGEADRVFGVDPATGEWEVAWLNSADTWMGSLADSLVDRGAAYWVQIREAHRDSVSIVMLGAPTAEQEHPRGVFVAGVHPIGPYWPAAQNLDEAGLVEAGMETVDTFFGSHPGSGSGPDAVLAWDAGEQRYEMGFATPTEWRGEVDRLLPGHGYLLFLNNTIDWTSNPRPGLNGLPPRGAVQAIPTRHRAANAVNASIPLPPGLERSPARETASTGPQAGKFERTKEGGR